MILEPISWSTSDAGISCGIVIRIGAGEVRRPEAWRTSEERCR